MSSKVTVKNVNIGIDEASRGKIAEGLSRLLADTYTLGHGAWGMGHGG